MSYQWKLKDVLMVAMIAVLSGIVMLGCTYAGGALQGVLTPAGLGSLAYEPFYGLYFFPGAFALFVMRKPGVGVVTEILGAIIETMLGNFFGPIIILSGLVQVYRDEPDGTRMLMASNGPGGSFGESLCFLKVKSAPVTIIAAEDSRVLWLSLDGVREGCRSYFAAGGCSDQFIHDVTMRVMACFASRALSMNDRIQVLSQRSLRKKIITLLTQYAQQAGGGLFSLPFGREDMAIYLGCDRSALSRELAAMKKEGLIDYYKNSFKVIGQ